MTNRKKLENVKIIDAFMKRLWLGTVMIFAGTVMHIRRVME
jgi:hypothetical protein